MSKRTRHKRFFPSNPQHPKLVIRRGEREMEARGVKFDIGTITGRLSASDANIQTMRRAEEFEVIDGKMVFTALDVSGCRVTVGHADEQED